MGSMARKSFSHYEQLQILAEQDYKCRQCSTRFSKTVHPQFDHIDGDNSNNHIENGQAICANCHDVKSRKENAKRSHEKKDFDFVKDVGVTFNDIVRDIISQKMNEKFTKKDKEIQLLKRGRYVEYNLLYDRGTKFGLNTGGNIDAILMSMPPNAKWK